MILNPHTNTNKNTHTEKEEGGREGEGEKEAEGVSKQVDKCLGVQDLLRTSQLIVHLNT